MDVKITTVQRFIVLSLWIIAGCQAQPSKIVGGPCEGCEAIFEYGNRKLTATDTLPGYESNEPKVEITGTVFRKDGKSPAENVILYIYHTNRKGIYEPGENATGWERRHGYIRGWIKTGKDGRYTFYTFRPGAYPDRREPEHIHITVKEPDKKEYYLDNYFFDDDTLLTPDKRKKINNRGGSGIVKPVENNGTLTIKRNITLGKNIPNYE